MLPMRTCSLNKKGRHTYSIKVKLYTGHKASDVIIISCIESHLLCISRTETPNITKKKNSEIFRSYLSNSNSISTYNDEVMHPHRKLFESNAEKNLCGQLTKKSDAMKENDHTNYGLQVADNLSATCPPPLLLSTSVQKGVRGRRRKIKSFVATDELSIEKSRRPWKSADCNNKVRLSTYIYIIDTRICRVQIF